MQFVLLLWQGQKCWFREQINHEVRGLRVWTDLCLLTGGPASLSLSPEQMEMSHSEKASVMSVLREPTLIFWLRPPFSSRSSRDCCSRGSSATRLFRSEEQTGILALLSITELEYIFCTVCRNIKNCNSFSGRQHQHNFLIIQFQYSFEKLYKNCTNIISYRGCPFLTLSKSSLRGRPCFLKTVVASLELWRDIVYWLLAVPCLPATQTSGYL